MSSNKFDLPQAIALLDAGGMVLVPNNRLRKTVLEAYARTRKQSVIACPRVEAVDVWVRMTWQKLAQHGVEPFCSSYVLDGVQEQLLWTRIVEESLDTYPLLNPSETARALSHAYQLMKQWQIDAPDASPIEQYNGIADVAAFLYWRGKFQILCKQQRCVNLVDAVAHLSRFLAENPLTDQVLLLNFYQPPPLYQQLFAAFNADYVETVSDQVVDIAQLPLQRHEFADSESEIRACANWAADTMRTASNARITVVCPAKEAVQAAFHSALRDALDSHSLIELEQQKQFFAESRHAPLTRSAMIRDALLLLGLHSDDQQADELCRLLRSPYLGNAEEEREARLQMEQFMRRHFSKRVSWQHFSDIIGISDKDYSCPLLAQSLLQQRSILRSSARHQNSAAWARVFNELLAAAGWPGEHLSARDQMLLQQWQLALEQFADASALLGKLSIVKAIEKLRGFCQQEGGQIASAYPIEFYSPTEAAGLSFDHLWLLGFTDQNWPASTSPSPFLPYDLQKQYKLPGSHSEVQYQAARSMLTVLLNSTRHSVQISHALSDGDQEFRPSSLTALLATAERHPASAGGLNRYFSSVAALPLMEHVTDAELPALDSQHPISGGHSIISDQSACPFRAFANHRLQIRQLEEFESGLTARDRGSAIHEALEYLYQQLPDHGSLQALDAEQRAAFCQEAAKVGVDFLYRKHRDVMTVRYREIELQRIAQLLARFLQHETERGDFTVTANEATLKWRHGPLQLNLRIDRIDQLADGSLAIIDYKTGKKTASPASWLLERSEDMQLPVYAVASSGNFTEPVSTLALAHVNVAGIEYSGLAEHGQFHRSIVPVEQLKQNEANWSELNAFFAGNVRRLAEQFASGVATVDPVNGIATCQYCGLEPLCRIQEKRRAKGSVTDAEELSDD